MNRALQISIFRYDPLQPAAPPRMQDYGLEETEGMTLFVALNRLREEQDPTLRFDFVCRASVCGSCGMLVNGRPRLACKTLTRDFPDGRIRLQPLPVFRLLGDLSVDTGVWFRAMTLRTEAWIHAVQPFDASAPEEPMDNATALAIYEAERCIECGCCVGGCLTANLRPDFLGAAGINRVARFLADPRDRRDAAQWFEVVGDDDGAFGCVGLMACDDHCPMGLPLQSQLAFVRRRMLLAGLRPPRGPTSSP